MDEETNAIKSSGSLLAGLYGVTSPTPSSVSRDFTMFRWDSTMARRMNCSEIKRLWARQEAILAKDVQKAADTTDGPVLEPATQQFLDGVGASGVPPIYTLPHSGQFGRRVSDPLTARQRDVFAMISQRLSNKRIASPAELAGLR